MRGIKSAPGLAPTAVASPLVLLVLLVLLAATACSGVPAATGGTPGAGGASAPGAADGGGASYGQQQGSGGGRSGTPGHQQSGVYTGSFSAAFARCMRAHGVPAFPDPDGKAGQLSHAGIDTHSVAYQDALYGPCKALAPAAWISAQPLGPPPTIH
jgi:hypothetical protein